MGNKLVTPDEIRQVRLAMVIQFPNCFVPKGAPKKPLKIGIEKDIRAVARQHFPMLSLRLIRGFLSDYLTGHNYHLACATGAQRVDLDGNIAGFVSESDATYHRDQIARIKAVTKKRRKRNKPRGAEPIGKIAKRVLADLKEMSGL